jgi:hypothetical protein
MWQTGSQSRSGQSPQSKGMTNGQSNGMSDGQTNGQLQQDSSTSPYGNGLIDSQMNGQTSDQEKKDEWKTDETNGTNGTNGQSDKMKSDQEKDQWKSDTNGMTNGTSGLQFRSDEQTTVSGTVQSTDTGTPGAMTAMDKAVLLKVQTDQGQSQTIYAGPRDFIQEKNMSFNNGDTITATGWKKTIAGQEVFIASKIEKDGQTLQLRDMQGNPEWKTEGSSLYNGMDSQQNSSHKDSSNGSNSESNSTY